MVASFPVLLSSRNERADKSAPTVEMMLQSGCAGGRVRPYDRDATRTLCAGGQARPYDVHVTYSCSRGRASPPLEPLNTLIVHRGGKAFEDGDDFRLLDDEMGRRALVARYDYVFTFADEDLNVSEWCLAINDKGA